MPTIRRRMRGRDVGLEPVAVRIRTRVRTVGHLAGLTRQYIVVRMRWCGHVVVWKCVHSRASICGSIT